MSGIYKISIKTMSFELGIEDCTKNLEDNINSKLLSYDFDKNVLWVRGKIKHDKSWTSPQRKKSVLLSVDEFNNCSFMGDFVEQYPWTLDLVLDKDKELKETGSGIGIVSDSGIGSGIDSSISTGYVEGKDRVLR